MYAYIYIYIYIYIIVNIINIIITCVVLLLLDTLEANGQQLVCCRNPWGTGEWQGKRPAQTAGETHVYACIYIYIYIYAYIYSERDKWGQH